MIFELLYQKIIKWLRRKKDCDHEFIKTGVHYSDYQKYDKLKCTKCHKKQKRPAGGGTYIML